LFPALLQGDNAISSIGEQLHKIARVKDHFDAVLIIRGGGGDIGLQAYNNYDLARNIAVSPIPVLTGIGHASNRTVSDMVAYKDVITPTDLAYYIVEKFELFEAYLQYAGEKLAQYASNSLQNHFKQLEYSMNSLVLHSRSLLQTYRAGLSQISDVTPLHARQKLKSEKIAMERIAEKIDLLSPENILKRGYSITYHHGKIVNDAETLQDGDEIVTRLYSGNFHSRVEKK